MDSSVNGRPWWFKAALLAGGALAILLLVNSIANYLFISRRIVIDHLRREMNKHVASAERQMRQLPPGAQGRIQAVLEQIGGGSDSLLWMILRDREGKVIARTGITAAETFTADYVRSRVRSREPVFKVVPTSEGEAVVEAFPVRVPPAEAGSPSAPALLEIASSVEGVKAVFWPVLRNVIINCTAALALLAALIAMALHFPSYLKGKQLEQQLEIARGVQQGLLPRPNTDYGPVHLAAECIPAWRVGGDFYDLFHAAEARLAMILGDVSGKGLPAALLMGVIHGAVRSNDWAASRPQHEDATARLNRLLCERTSGERFASMFWGYFDADACRLHYVNAGHCPPFVVRAGSGSVLALHEGGPVLGLIPAAQYQQGFVQIDGGDLLVLYSDGVVEAAAADGQEFGQERLEGIVRSNSRLTPDEIRGAVLDAVRTFAGGAQLSDDLTLVIARFEGGGQQQTLIRGRAATPVTG